MPVKPNILGEPEPKLAIADFFQYIFYQLLRNMWITVYGNFYNKGLWFPNWITQIEQIWFIACILLILLYKAYKQQVEPAKTWESEINNFGSATLIWQ